MNKLFGLFLLALAFLPSQSALAFNCFWVGGTGTWDSTSTANWAPTTGAAATGCATSNAAPTTGDNVTFDANSGGGTVTADSTINNLSLSHMVAFAFTGTIDLSVNNPNLTFTRNDGSAGLNLSGTGARKYLLGSGAFTFTGTAQATYFDIGTTTNLDPTSVTTAAIIYTATTSSERQINGGGRTLGAFTVSTNTSRGGIRIFGANTFSSWSVAAGTNIQLPSGTTVITSAGSIGTGSSSSPMIISPASNTSGTVTLSLSGAATSDWISLVGITTTGAGSLTATNCLNFGRVTLDSGDTCTVPSAGGGGSRIIGG